MSAFAKADMFGSPRSAGDFCTPLDHNQGVTTTTGTTPAAEAAPPTHNWAGNLRYGFTRHLRPRTLTELQEQVAAEPRLRVIGSRHSFTAITDGDVALSLAGLPDDVEVDVDAGTVTCSGGATFGALAASLEAHGLALANLASLPHISVAGAVATGTHGSGAGLGNLATAVRALTFVTADGALRTVTRGEPDFAGAVVHLGALGVVHRVTLDVEPAYEVAQTVHPGLGWDVAEERLREALGAAYSVSLFTDWGPAGVTAWVKRRVGTDALAGTTGDFLGVPAATTPQHPVPGEDPVACTEQLGAPGPWSERLPHFRMGFTPSSGEEIQSEWHVPAEHGPAAVAALRGVHAEIAPLLMISEIRAVAADDLWLSPMQGRDTVSLHFTWVRDQAGVEAAARVVEQALSAYDPRPHWGKLYSHSPAVLDSYPQADAFRALRERWDPEHVFTNAWTARLLD
ncbi:putative xylitol oxidase [Nocardioides sp. AX2bis]|nr:putative xylitol oxidase [Nocardioides sp. AX2bis]